MFFCISFELHVRRSNNVGTARSLNDNNWVEHENYPKLFFEHKKNFFLVSEKPHHAKNKNIRKYYAT